MVVSIVSPEKTKPPHKPRLSTGLGYAFATLGLRAGEARIDAIRRATTLSSGSLRQAAEEGEDLIPLLADIATSAYRLLDPRKRVRKTERIQLCLISERALDLKQQSRQSLLKSTHSHRSTAGVCDLSA
jgi:hypothetical protein